MWIHQHKDWANFEWKGITVSKLLIDITHKQGLLLGKMSQLGFDIQQEANAESLITNIITSSAIEGEQLNAQEVRSSVARKLGLPTAGLPKASRHIDGFVDIMLDATTNHTKPLTKERLFAWHAALFPNGYSGIQPITVGNWRPKSAGAMQVVSGAMGNEKVHFEAVEAKLIEKQMKQFFTMFNQDISTHPIVQAAIIHLWFVTIHPFEDGNGRIARVLSDMMLAKADNTTKRFYSMSSQLEKERNDYYMQLEKQQRGSLNITPWILWFIGCYGRAIDNAGAMLEKVLFKASLWQLANQYSINDRQRLIINKMLDDFKGYMNSSKYAKITKCSQDTALRDIKQLLDYGILQQNESGGRSTSYKLISDIKL